MHLLFLTAKCEDLLSQFLYIHFDSRRCFLRITKPQYVRAGTWSINMMIKRRSVIWRSPRCVC
jgi:hypothetical protein